MAKKTRKKTEYFILKSGHGLPSFDGKAAALQYAKEEYDPDIRMGLVKMVTYFELNYPPPVIKPIKG